MKPENNDEQPQLEQDQQVEDPKRRAMLGQFGKYAAYAAPFTVMALTQKADAATGRGSGKHK